MGVSLDLLNNLDVYKFHVTLFKNANGSTKSTWGIHEYDYRHLIYYTKTTYNKNKYFIVIKIL